LRRRWIAGSSPAMTEKLAAHQFERDSLE